MDWFLFSSRSVAYSPLVPVAVNSIAPSSSSTSEGATENAADDTSNSASPSAASSATATTTTMQTYAQNQFFYNNPATAQSYLPTGYPSTTDCKYTSLRLRKKFKQPLSLDSILSYRILTNYS